LETDKEKTNISITMLSLSVTMVE